MGGTAFLVVGLNPTLQNTFFLQTLRPGQVNRVIRHRVDVAGKGGNTTRVLVQLGENAIQLTYHGGRNGDLYAALCESESIVLEAAKSQCEVRFCHTMVDLDRNEATEVVENGGPVDLPLERDIMERYKQTLAVAHTVIIAGSRASGFSDSVYPEMARSATQAGIPVMLDIRGRDLLGCMEFRPALIKINVAEFSQTFLPGLQVDETSDPASLPGELQDKALDIRRRYGTEVVLTHGAHPVLYVNDEAVDSITPEPIVPVNPIGSGDSFTAGIAAGLHRGDGLREAVRLGMMSAGRNAMLEKPGSIE